MQGQEARKGIEDEELQNEGIVFLLYKYLCIYLVQSRVCFQFLVVGVLDEYWSVSNLNKIRAKKHTIQLVALTTRTEMINNV